MGSVRLPMAVCAAVAEVLQGSHPTLEALFLASGAPGPAPILAHHSKWKTWLFQAGNDPNVDSLRVLGNLIEEFMDLPPAGGSMDVLDDVFGSSDSPVTKWKRQRDRLNGVLTEHGFQYFRGGRVMPTGELPAQVSMPSAIELSRPASVENLLETLINGLPRAMHPLTHRRKGAAALSFDIEADIQDLLHAQLRPWVKNIIPEEFTPSYAGSNTRMDFLLPDHKLVLEVKRVRDRAHGTKIGNELIIDIEHYSTHAKCGRLWCVIYDPNKLLQNPAGLASSLEGKRVLPGREVIVRVFVV